MVATREEDKITDYVSRRMRGHQRIAELARSNEDQMRLGYTLAIITMILGMLDVLSTDAGLATGLAYEANPVIAAIMGSIGGFYFVPKMIITAGIATLIMWSPNRVTLGIMALCSGWMTSIVTNNFLISFGYVT